MIEKRPWGFFQVLVDEPDHKIKRIVVNPSQRLSYQRHFKRDEHWFVLKGRAVAVLNGEEIQLESRKALDIRRKDWHRIMNQGDEDLVFVEIQTGESFDEDDIERVEDDYGRA